MALEKNETIRHLDSQERKKKKEFTCKVGILDIRTLEARGRQYRIIKYRPPERTAIKIGPIHYGIRKVGAVEVGIAQVPLRELRLAELGVRDVRARHDDAGQIVFVPPHAAQIAFAQIVQFVARGIGLSHLGRI